MSKFILNVENMVCPRCVLAVENLCATLSIEFETVKLGKIYLTENTEVSIKKKEELNQELQKIGLQLIESDRERLISELKITIINQIHYSEKALKINFSEYLSEELHYDYSYLSRLFSASENITIEKYIALQKIEKAKELLLLQKYRINEIADYLHYKSTPHFSTQFKKITGQTPSDYKENN
ncbi:helix-turn-helix transcriptional regulator [Bernardetia sp. ABR2-2B]|jgi:AraC-like DNA-binding protein|uniref:helix-turn-helix domain-containing protein n=1 Tax=unclassified Bernardetia TaxID=2647129 RepID=UPI0030CA7FAB